MFTKEFEAAVGEIVASHATVKSVTLTIEVNEPSWGTQLIALKPQLLKTLSKYLGIRVKDFNVIMRRTDG